jgi:hypothetical protein
MPHSGQSGNERRRHMKVELLYIADYPNIEAARRLLKEALRDLGLPDEISEIEVCDSERAEALTFPGSPTVRVDDKDVERLPGRGGNGLSCRTYLIDGTRRGVPSQEIVRTALRSAVSLANREKKES